MSDYNGSINILHVDDEPDFVEMAATTVERENDRFDIETATSPSEGLDRLESETVDCIVSDFEMPTRNGLEFLQDVREEYPDLPFILYTGKGSEEVASDAISAGVTDYLEKGSGTSQFTVLANRIRNAVDNYYAQIELAEREKRLNLFFEQSPLGVVEWDERFDVVRMNDAAEDILGYTQDDLVGHSWEKITSESNQDAVADVVSDLLENQGGYRSVNENIRKDGDRIICEWHNRVVTDEDGEVVAVFSQFQDITERRERQQELERMRGIFSEAERLGKLGVWEFTACGEVSWSEGTRRIHEVDESFEPTVETGIEFYHPDDRDMIEQAVGNALETGKPYDVVARLITANDNERWIRTRGKLLDDGETVRGYIQDINDRKNYEQQLQEEQQFVDSIFDALPDLLYTFDTESQLIRWNKHLEERSGYISDELDGMSVPEFIPEDDAEQIAETFQQVLSERQTMTVESAFETKTGEQIPYEYTGGPLEDANGNLRGVTGVGRDLTARKERENRLKELNKTAQELMTAETREQIAEIGINATREILQLNANAIYLHDEDVPGLVPVAVTDASYDLVGEPPVFREEEGIAWRVFEQEEPIILDNVADDPDVYNPDTDIESELLLPIDKYGVLLAGSDQPMSFSEDDRVFGEILVGSLAAALAQIERTEQLRSREQELKRKNERLEEFASVVSHDLRNPLSVASGWLELAQADCDTEHLDAIEQAHNRMDTLIADLLKLAREGEQVSDTEELDFPALIEDCWKNANTVDATLHTEAAGTIRADQSRLQQLLENLLRNAVDHGGESVTVTIGQLADGFYIEDDGPGIPKADRNDVFEAGYSTSNEGTGFGLNIVREVVEAHDWDIRVTEGSDGGARFEITEVEVTAD